MKKSYKLPLPSSFFALEGEVKSGVFLCLPCSISHNVQFGHPGTNAQGWKGEAPVIWYFTSSLSFVCRWFQYVDWGLNNPGIIVSNQYEWTKNSLGPQIYLFCNHLALNLYSFGKFVATKGDLTNLHWLKGTTCNTTHLTTSSELEAFLLPESSCIISSQGLVPMN